MKQSSKDSHIPHLYVSLYNSILNTTKTADQSMKKSQISSLSSLNSKNPYSSPPANSHAGAYSPALLAPQTQNNTRAH